MALKRTGFARPSFEEALEKKKQADIRRSKRAKSKKATRVGVKPKKLLKRKISPHKGYKTPSWFNSIPVGSHGSNPTQKRYWKVISDFVRQRDFKRYRGRCVSCGKDLADWKDGDCAHFKAWSVCNGFFKYEVANLALSCKNCNRLSDGVIGVAFGEELKRRYGEKHLEWIEKENRKHSGEKMEVWLIVERVEKLIDENPDFMCP